MSARVVRAVLLICCLVLSACAMPRASGAGPVQRLLEAFNAHDVEAMTGYFRSLPSARSEIEVRLVTDGFVAVRERAHWEQDGQSRSQAALAVYELRGDLVARVWYFAPER